MTDTPQEKTAPAKGLTPGHWIAIATIAVGILGGVINVALSEHNARISNIETAVNTIAQTLVRMEGESKATRERLAGFVEQVNERFNQNDERLNRIETSIDRLVQTASGRPDDAAGGRTRRIGAERRADTRVPGPDA